MLSAKSGFFRDKALKLFLTVWIVYAFYLQMFGLSGMANSQSALTAAIVNEGSFSIDAYYRAGGGGIAFYDGHYYSGQAPGISFISVPLYLAAKPIFYILPQGWVDYIIGRLDSYGADLPADYHGNEKIPSDYFPGLSSRQVLEYLIISGFILPVFTTSLVSALSVVLLYLFLKKFTGNDKLRTAIALFYAFGTILFPLSTEFFERPIAIALIFAAFIILFKVRHERLKAKKSAIFAAGTLAGISVWFDYFHLIAAALLFLYLLFIIAKQKAKEAGSAWIFNLSKSKLILLLPFIIGAAIPVVLLSLYFYIVFDNPFTQSYAYTVIPESVHTVSGILNIKFPTINTLFRMLEFFIYSPIILLALYGVHMALSKKDAHYPEALAVLIFTITTFIYASLLAFAYPSSIAPSFKRYMTPILPFIFIFLPYIFAGAKALKMRNMKVLFVALGILSIFMNWMSAQFGGHQGLGHFNLDSKQFEVIPQLLENGPSSSFLRAFAGVFGADPLLIGLIGLTILISILYIVWRPYLETKPAS